MVSQLDVDLSRQALDVLKNNYAINFLNFSLGEKFNVYPTAYSSDVYARIQDGRIRVGRADLPKEKGGQYSSVLDKIIVSNSFSMEDTGDQALFIHESTHAHLDIQKMGKVSNHHNEALAYLAEAVFLEAWAHLPLTNDGIRIQAHRIAKKIVKGAYWVSKNDVQNLVNEVAGHSNYRDKIEYVSNGTKPQGFRVVSEPLNYGAFAKQGK